MKLVTIISHLSISVVGFVLVFFLTYGFFGSSAAIVVTPAFAAAILTYTYAPCIKMESGRNQNTLNTCLQELGVEGVRVKTVKDGYSIGLTGFRRIQASRPFTLTLSNQELEAVMYHELGHVKYCDVLMVQIYLNLLAIGFLILGAFSALVALTYLMVGALLILWRLRMSEYRADRVAVECGRAKELACVLGRLNDGTIVSWWNTLIKTHPPIEKRTKRIRKYGKSLRRY